MDIEQKDVVRIYRHLFENSGILNRDESNDIDINMFVEGFMIIRFDLTPDKTNGSTLRPPEVCIIELSIKFKKALSKPVECIILSEYQDVLNVDKNGKIKYSTET